MKDFIEQNWPVGEVKELLLLTERGERKLYKITTSKGVYSFKINDAPRETVIRKDTEILEFLNKQSFPVPKLINSNGGLNYLLKNGKCSYLLEFIDGKEPEPTNENYFQLGRIVAQLHGITEQFPYQTDYTPKAIITRLLNQAQKFNLDKYFVQLVESIPSFEGLPMTIIHTDIGFNNTVQKDNGDIFLIDWDDAGVGYPVLDLGWVLINSFLREDKTYEKDKALAFFRGYVSIRKITEEEKRSIFWGGFLICLDYAFSPDGKEERWTNVQYVAKHREIFERIVKSL